MKDKRLTAEKELIRMWMDDGDKPLDQAGAEIRKYGDLRAAEARKATLEQVDAFCVKNTETPPETDWHKGINDGLDIVRLHIKLYLAASPAPEESNANP